jgi:O-antigen ligase
MTAPMATTIALAGRPQRLVIGATGLALVAAFNLLIALGLAAGRVPATVAIAVVPAALIALGALISSNRSALLFAALALHFTASPALLDPLPLPGPDLFVSDLLVMLALVSWLARRLTSASGHRPTWPSTAVLRFPFLLFACALLLALGRGNAEYGTNILGPQLRLVLYAGIAFALTDISPRELHRLIVAVFYTGTVWQTVLSAYYIATGTSQTDQTTLSTGGTRILAASMGMYLTGALVLALLNLELTERAGRRVFHLSMAGLALFGIVLAFGRATFLAFGLILPVLIIASKRLRWSTVTLLPLLLPALIVVVLMLPKAAPEFFPTLEQRLTSPVENDVNVTWREHANAVIVDRQIRESPLLGVGVGKTEAVLLDGVHQKVPQDPHNSFLFLWAAGGLFLLGTFALLIVTSLAEIARRLRSAQGVDRVLLFWGAATLFVFLTNAAAGPILNGRPDLVLMIWILLLLPSVVPKRDERAHARADSSRPFAA